MDIREQMRNMDESDLIKLSHNPKTPQSVYAKEELDRREIEKSENSANERLSRIEKHLDELKKPHWTVTPTFYFAMISAIAAIIIIALTLILKS